MNRWIMIFCAAIGISQCCFAQDHYAVLIGVETYDTSTFSNLKYAADDAVALGEQLKLLGFKTTVMTSESDSSRLRPTTPKKIADVIAAVARSCANDDTLLIALSGHGVQFSDEDLLPTGVRESYFCPSDANLADKSTLLKISSIVNFMNSSPASRKLLLVDACQENVLSEEGQKKGAKRIELGSVHENRRSVPGGMAVLFSCSSGQFSWEHDPLSHSVFSYHVIEYFKGSAQERYYDDGHPELNGLVSYVAKYTNDYVIEKNLTPDGQYPVLRGSSSNWPLGEFQNSSPQQFTNSLKMTFTLIPAGTFMMGSKLSAKEVNERYPGGQESYYEDEHPVHQVTISRPFYMGIHEVTLGQFRKFVEATGYQTEAEKDGKGGYGIDMATGEYRQGPEFTWRNPGFEQRDSEPVVNVSWNDADAFCKWLGQQEGRTYRLPTEAEWEYACRAGSDTDFHLGDNFEELTRYDNVADAAAKQKFSRWPTVESSDGYVTTAPVGSFRPNAFGLYDMHGNVREWCGDKYAPYTNTVVTDPVGPLTGEHSVNRGGCWNCSAGFCRAALRYWDAPVHRNYYLGFRLVSVSK